MVSRDKYAALPLLPPLPASPDARMTGHVLANAMRQAYLYAQTQGRMCGWQTYTEETFDPASTRSFLVSDFRTIAIFRKHLPPWANSVRAKVGYQLYSTTPSCFAWHRVSMSYGGNTDTGPETVETVNVGADTYNRMTSTFVPRIYAGDDALDSDPGVNGIFGVYDLPNQSAECFAEIDNITLDSSNIVTITVSAYATKADTLTVEATAAERVSNVVTATVPTGHNLILGMDIWTDGFTDNVPRGSPSTLTGVTSTTVTWDMDGADDPLLGDGTIYTAVGIPVTYRPGVVTAWWEG